MGNNQNEGKRVVKSSFSSGGHTFISYASDWDLHKGTKKWSELSIIEQNKFFDDQFSLAGKTQWDQAIKSDLLKSHASGIRSLIVYVFLALRDYSLTEANEITDANVAYELSESLDRIVLGRRIREYVENKDTNVSNILDSDLEYLSRLDEVEAPFDDFYKFKRYLLTNLENCKCYADSPSLYEDHAQQIMDQLEIEHKRKMDAKRYAENKIRQEDIKPTYPRSLRHISTNMRRIIYSPIPFLLFLMFIIVVEGPSKFKQIIIRDLDDLIVIGAISSVVTYFVYTSLYIIFSKIVRNWKSRKDIRLWCFCSLLWIVGFMAFAALFDPFDYGGWSYMRDEEILHIVMVMFVPPTFFSSAYYFYGKYVK